MKRDDTLWKSILEDIFDDDPHFSRRMFTYYSRILDKYDKPITAFAIFTDANRSFRPCEYYREFMGTSVLYRYNALKIMDQDDEMLLKSDNPFAVVMMTVKTALKSKGMSDEQLITLKMKLAKNLLAKNFSKRKIRKLMLFLRQYVRFEKYESMVKFDNEVDVLTQRTTTMGIEEFLTERFRKEGETRQMIIIAGNLLRETSMSIEKIAEIVGASKEFVLCVKQGKNPDLSLE